VIEESQSLSSILDLIKCKYYDLPTNYSTGDLDNCYDHARFDKKYIIIPAHPGTGILYVTSNSPFFISGQVRMRGKNGGRYPYHYLEMIDTIFGRNDNTVEVCSGDVKGNCFSVDINPEVKPDLISDGQSLAGISDGIFNRWRCDPPYNARTARGMYGTELPITGKLLKLGARVCKVGSIMFLLLGPQNYQMCPAGVRRIGWIPISIVPNNEVRCLNIYLKYEDA
jgi:hypothetical protein